MISQDGISDKMLLERYIDICNQAILLNCDIFPFKQIFHAVQTSKNNSMSNIIIYDEFKTSYFKISLGKKGMQIERTRLSVEIFPDWKVSRQYLERVVCNPAPFIINPAKIDWSWII